MKKRVLNLGAGTQSSLLQAWIDRGLLPPVDVSIFSDTQSEPLQVYEHLKWLAGVGFEQYSTLPPRWRAIPGTYQGGVTPSVKTVVVTAGNLREDALEFMQNRVSADKKRFASMPLHVLNPDGSNGMLRRQCTREYKVIPIERYIRRELLGVMPKHRVPAGTIVEQIFGLHFDERSRMRNSTKNWSVFEYPLIDMKMRRLDVIKAAEAMFPEHPFPRSACIECPYLSNKESREMRDNRPDEWKDRVSFDYAIRDRDRERQRQRATAHAEPYLHRSCVPLDQANLDDEQGEFAFGMENECEGMCGV